MRGPSLLLKNTLAGFRNIDVKPLVNLRMHNLNSTPVWIPAGDLSSLNEMEIELLSDSKLTLGPNIDWFNVGIADIISQLKRVKILVPHDWVVEPVRKSLPSNCEIFVWYSGINTDFWKRKRSVSLAHKVLVYVKNLRDLENLSLVKNYLRNNNISFVVLEYGSYSQARLKLCLNQVSSAIWIGGTESQGLALLECWSMNVPTLVLRNETWHSPDGTPYPASSAPYMSDKMGQFSSSSEFVEADFENFFSKLDFFSPRESVELKYNLNDCASQLFSIFQL